MNILAKIITAFCSFSFVMIGLDKFKPFLEPACSLQAEIPTVIWTALGAMQILAGILIWHSKFRRYIVGFFSVFMLVFTLVHITQGQPDFGGSASMAVLLGLLAWNPPFLKAGK